MHEYTNQRLVILFITLSICHFASSFIVSGTAFNSYDHSKFSGASITMKDNNDGTIYTGTSGSGGLFSVSVPSGIYSFNITAPGKWYTNINPLPVTSDIYNYDFALVDMKTDMNFEFMVFWGSRPLNLDVYIFTNAGCNASRFSTSCTSDGATATWAYDVQTGWGPESAKLNNAAPGRYEFWVNLVKSADTDNFLMGQSTKLPTAYANFPTANPSVDAPASIQITTASQASDSSYTWWRAAVLVVSAKRDVTRSNFEITFPNEVYTAPPTLPFTTPTPSPPSTPPPPSPPAPTPSTPSTPAPVTPTPSASTSASSSTPPPPPPPTTPAGPGGWQAPVSPGVGTKPPVGDKCTENQVEYCQNTMGLCLEEVDSSGEITTCDCYTMLGGCLQEFECTDNTDFQDLCNSAGCDSCSQYSNDASKQFVSTWITMALILVATFGI